jgi:hypothetical protein
MKTLRAATFLIIALFIFADQADAQQWVTGYYRSDGTYVGGYYRTSPDGNPYNNYSYPGNYNPNTGRTTPGNSSTYLRNYYNRSWYSPNYTIPAIQYYYRY